MAVHGNLRSQEANLIASPDSARATRVFIVEDKDNAAIPNDPSSAIDAALNAVGWSIGESTIIGSDTYFVDRIHGRPIRDGGAIQVNVEFKSTAAVGLPRFWSGALGTERTNLAYNPEVVPPMEQVRNVPIVTRKGGPEGRAQPHLVDVMRPTMVYSRTFLVTDFNTPDFSVVGPPQEFIMSFLGHTNLEPVGPGLIYQPRTLLITRMHVEKEFSPQEYEIEIEFSYRADTWDVTVIHLVNGMPVEFKEEDPDAVPPVPAPTEIQTYRIYPVAAFSLISPTL